ncbi:MAG: bifunctional phosphoglucose/phosphomannose isomerase [candidate division WOR-3 bacterium]|nr:bifunctional phosphoglucose/phosphomannose isomerase [candidate division WOR-3 bacterium]
MNMKELIKEFPHFIEEGYDLTDSYLPFPLDEIDNILYAGMGGSAIAGDMLSEILHDHLNIPMSVVRNYSIPAYVSDRTLVIISSFSGNTEETLSAAEEAMEKNAKVIMITTGGKLRDFGSRADMIELDYSLPPRTALGITLFALLKKLKPLYSSNDKICSDIEEAVKTFSSYSIDYKRAEEIADALSGRVPLIYSSVNYASVSRRFANQLAENAKHFAHFNELPEMNHNEIAGIKNPLNTDDYIVIFFKYMKDNERINRRIDITRSLLEEAGFECITLEFKDNSLISRIDSIILTDMVSYLLSEMNNEDSIAIARIDELKERMKH